MATLGEWLDKIIPIVIVIVGVYLLYRPLAEPLSGLWNMIRSIVQWIKSFFVQEEPYAYDGLKMPHWED